MSILSIDFDGNGGPLKGWQSLLLNAWGMTHPKSSTAALIVALTVEGKIGVIKVNLSS